METTRQNKISRLLQKELSEIFLLQTKAMHGTLVSVSAVRISPDMSIARVYLSVFPSEKAEEMVKNINDNMKSIKNRKRADQCKRSKSYSAHRNAGYDINGIMFLLRKKITPGYIKRKIQLCNKLFHFSKESIFSI